MSLSAVSFSRSPCGRGVPIYIMGACIYVICAMSVCVKAPTILLKCRNLCDEACHCRLTLSSAALQPQIARHTRRIVCLSESRRSVKVLFNVANITFHI